MNRPDRVLDWRPNPAHWTLSEEWRLNAIATCSGLAERKTVRRTKTVWLDQRREGACTGFGAEHVMALTPYSQVTNDDIARGVYYGARRHDEWAGEDYEGSSVNGAMRAEREMGHILAWYWARRMAEVRHGLSYHSAGEAGTWIYTGMMEPDSEGHIHPTGSLEGGHAYAISGYELAPRNGIWVRRYRQENSWGQDWGDNGGSWIWEDELEQLLDDDGEFAVVRKARS